MIPRPSALAVLVVGNKTLKHPRDKAPAAPRIENRECSLDETKGKNKTDLPTNPKWQIGLFLWLKPYRGGAGIAGGAGAKSVSLFARSPSGVQGCSPGAPLGTFPATGKSPGSEGRSALPSGECRGGSTSGAPPRIGSAGARSPCKKSPAIGQNDRTAPPPAVEQSAPRSSR